MPIDILGWLDKANEYAPLIKTGTAVGMGVASFLDQKEKNKLQKQAYHDYMQQVEAAGQEAQAAIDINYTPMVVSGVPTTKADVTDFTAVAAKGGLMSIPTRQRKRYARGPEEVDLIEFEEESITPFGLQQETGIPFTGEQVFYNTGRGDRANARMIWDQMDSSDKMPFDFDFEIFFMDGGWRDMIKGEAPNVQGETQMASHEANTQLLESLYEQYLELGLSPDEAAKKAQEEFDSMGQVPVDQQGIMQAAQGGRIGYKDAGDVKVASDPGMGEGPFMYQEYLDAVKDGFKGSYDEFIDQIDRSPWDYAAQGGRIGYRLGTPDTMIADQETILKTPNEEVVTDSLTDIEGQTAGLDYGSYKDFIESTGDEELMNLYIDFLATGDFTSLGEALKRKGYPVDFAKGGRVKRDNGGIMNLGGLEKDYRTTGGFVPIGEYEKKDDVPARLSKNEFVMTADAVRAAGGGSINKGAKRMYETMKNLEAQPTAKRMTA